MSLGPQLVRARERMGYRQEDVASVLGVTRAMISYWESDHRKPNDRQLAALSRLYRTSVASLLTGQGLEDADEEAAMLFRGAEADVPPGARPGIEEFKAFLNGYARLGEAVGTELRGMHQSPFVEVKGSGSMEDARRKAEEVRAHLRTGLGPIADLDAVCELLGVTVYRTALGSNLLETISGGFFAHPIIGFSLLVNLEMTPGRRRFTVAHELCHALFHSGPKTKFILSGTTKDPRERFADWFAGEFLMPTEGIRRVLEEHGIGPRITEPGEVIHLQRYFNVSYATALVRLRQGKFLSQLSYQEFQTVRPIVLARALGYEIDDEEFVQDPEDWRIGRFPGRFLRLLRMGVRGDHVSVPTAAKLTGLSIDDIADLVGDQAFVGEEDRTEIGEYEATGVA
jgi:Zn-dependent peptidase ImmA (M78 family)/DNA-binding XRE family transcriptional regulator